MKTFIFLCSLGLTGYVFADPSNEAKLYESCYKKFTGMVFSWNSVFASQVRSGAMTGKDACMRLLDMGNLSVTNATGVSLPVTGNGTYSPVAIAILRTFHQLHGSFAGEGYNGRKDDELANIYDYNSPSQYFTKHLLTPNPADYPFSKTFSDNKSYRTLRDDPFPKDRLQYWGPQHGRGSYGVYCTQNCTLKITTMTIPQYLIDRNSQTSPYKDEFGDGTIYNRTFSVGDFARTGSHNAALDLMIKDVPPVQRFGSIVGFEFSPKVSFDNLHMFPTGIGIGRRDGYARNYLNFRSLKQPYPFPADDIFFNPGLGALSAPEKVLSSFGFADGEGPNAAQDGANRVPRKWAESFFKEALCRDLPVMRLADSAAYVERPANPELKFRNSIFCMGCHASMDSLGFLTRNHRNAGTGQFLSGGTTLDVNAYLKPFLPAEHSNIKYAHLKDRLARPASDELFPYRLADADFRFRDMYGRLHDVHLTATVDDQFRSYKQLAAYIGGLDDTYACFASKYLDYLTGIKIRLFDPGAPDAPRLSVREQALYNYLIRLGKDFKSHQSAKLLIADIVSSDLFLHPYDGKVPGAR